MQRGAAPSPLPPAGYEPQQLDNSLVRYLAVCERTIRHADNLGKKIEAVFQALADSPGTHDAMDDANKVSVLFERLTKAGLNLVKATDELSRLRSFLAGGPDHRADLTVKGEVELRALIFAGIKALGWRVMDAQGNAIELEG